MARKYQKLTLELLKDAVKDSVSAAQSLRKLGRKPVGGNYKMFWEAIDKLEVDTSHFLGAAHNKGKEFVPLEGLKRNKNIKERLLKEFGHSCFSCGLHTWMDYKIPLELDHIDGNNRNNSKDNLRLLCPNCHALTPTWRNKKRLT